MVNAAVLRIRTCGARQTARPRQLPRERGVVRAVPPMAGVVYKVGMVVRVRDDARPEVDRGKIARVVSASPAEVRVGQQWMHLGNDDLSWSGFWSEELEIPSPEEVTLWLLAQ